MIFLGILMSIAFFNTFITNQLKVLICSLDALQFSRIA